ncbi:MAG: GAF domain-containing protein [Actinomycetota bacterium]|nr:GAF domain-containing protein [Actinomycetota bacterium]
MSPGASRGWDSLLPQLVELTGEELDRGELMARVAAVICDATGADACFVHLLDDALGHLVLAGATPPFDQLVGTIELALGEGVAGWVAQHGVPAVVEDKWHDTRYRYIPALRGEDFTSMVSLPLVRPGRRVVGVFNLHTRERREFTPAEIEALIPVAGLLAGIVENALLYHRLAEREAEVERFAARTIELQELERRRLAGEIHDGISQRVVSLWFRLSAAEALLSTGPAGPVSSARAAEAAVELAEAKALATAALEETRRAITGLRPSVLDDLGLAAGLDHLARGLPGVEPEVEVSSTSLAPHVETALFRIAQEALQNVARHAQATWVRVSLTEDPAAGVVRLEVADDGIGFDPSTRRPDAYGLAGMAERAALTGGRLEVASRSGGGTTVAVTVPGA